MQKYEAIEQGIRNGDVQGLRAAIGSICYTSRDFSSGEFDEAIRYVESKGIKLKDDALEGEIVSEGKAVYADEDFARAIFELKKNFCDERIEDVKKRGRSLYAQPKPKKAAGAGPNAYSHQPVKQPGSPVGILVATVIVMLLIVIFFILVMK